jgi:glucan biosynthesis protein C
MTLPSPPYASPIRYHALDGLRAVMMLLGLVLHTVVSYMDTPPSPAWAFRDASGQAVWTHLMLFIHVFRMPVFFVMAGFFAALLLERRHTRGLLRNRTMRILVPFVIGWIILSPLVLSGFIFAVTAQTSTWADGWWAVVGSGLRGLYRDSTLHLWFLYYLLLFYSSAILLTVCVRRTPRRWQDSGMQLFERLVKSRARVLWLSVPTTALLMLMPVGILKVSTSFVPDPKTFLLYALFFGFGWLLYGCRHLLVTFDRLAWVQVIAAVILGPVNWMAAEAGIRGGADTMLTAITAVSGALITWLLVFGLTGLFQRYFDRQMPSVRYVVDSSYWLYLLYLPFTIWIPGLLATLSWPAGAKILVVLSATIAVCLITYDLFVRNTFIGQVLNGRRYQRGLPTRETGGAAAPSVA